MTATVATAASERLSGERVPRRRALAAAVVTGVAAAVTVYRLLRS